jgi:hypothetical protein
MVVKRLTPRTSRTHNATTAPSDPAHCPRGDMVAQASSQSFSPFTTSQLSLSEGGRGQGQCGGPPPPPPSPLAALPALASPSTTDHVRPRRQRSSFSASSFMAGKRPAPRTSRTHDATTAPGGPVHCPRGNTVTHAWSRLSFSEGRGGRGRQIPPCRANPNCTNTEPHPYLQSLPYGQLSLPGNGSW